MLREEDCRWTWALFWRLERTANGKPDGCPSNGGPDAITFGPSGAPLIAVGEARQSFTP